MNLMSETDHIPDNAYQPFPAIMSAYVITAFSRGGGEGEGKLRIVIYAQTRGQTPLFFRIYDRMGMRKTSFTRPTAEHSRDLVALSFSLFINRYFYYSIPSEDALATVLLRTLH